MSMSVNGKPVSKANPVPVDVGGNITIDNVSIGDVGISDGENVLKIDEDGAALIRVAGSYFGYSYEDKNDIVPNPKRNDTFLELDTGRVFGYGTKWEEI